MANAWGRSSASTPPRSSAGASTATPMTVNQRRNPPNPATHKEILVSKATTTLPTAPRHRTRARLAAVVGAVASAVAVWLIARYGTGLHLHTPAFGSAHRPATLTSGVAAAVTATASAAIPGLLGNLFDQRPQLTTRVVAAADLGV